MTESKNVSGSDKKAVSTPASKPESASRYERVVRDPRFRRPGKKASRLQVDSRFQHMFHDPKFTRPYSVDKYGRKIKDAEGAGKRELETFYRLDKPEAEAEAETKTETETETEEDSDAFVSEGSASDTEDSEPELEDTTLDEAFNQHPLVNANIPLGEATRRVAVVNLDWDNIKAVDLFVLFNGFKPPAGQIHSVTIYPSSFGKERMAKEAIEGPPRDIFKKESESVASISEQDTDSESGTDSDIDDPLADLKGKLVEEAGEFDQSALRRYQLDRMKYFYAVVECDSVETAAAIYSHCDSLEFESSTTALDLRYVPEDVSFEADEPHDTATRIPPRYTPKFAITTDALQRSSVQLSWDQDDPERQRLTRVNFGKVTYEEADLAAYLASTDDEEDQFEPVSAKGKGKDSMGSKDSKEERIAKYRALLLKSGKDEEEANVFGRRSHADNDDLKITFTSGISVSKDNTEESTSESDSELESSSESASESEEMAGERVAVFDADGNLVQNIGDAAEETRQSTRRNLPKKEEPLVVTREWTKKSEVRAKRSRSKLASMADEEEESDLRSADFAVNVSDPRFAAVYDSPAFAIDPTAADYKLNEGMQAIIAERQKRRYGNDEAGQAIASSMTKKKTKKVMKSKNKRMRSNGN
jgi:hypothetical protein